MSFKSLISGCPVNVIRSTCISIGEDTQASFPEI
nr:MAG TPA: hypothetical protein [Bacteriophage sp.]